MCRLMSAQQGLAVPYVSVHIVSTGLRIRLLWHPGVQGSQVRFLQMGCGTLGSFGVFGGRGRWRRLQWGLQANPTHQGGVAGRARG